MIAKSSISVRLTLWFSAIFLAGFVCFGVVMWWDLAWSLSQGRDRTLSRRAERAVDQLNASRHDSPERRRIRLDEFIEGTPEGNLIQFFDDAGRRSWPEAPWPADFPWPGVPRDLRDRLSTVRFAGGAYRVLQRPARVNGRNMWIFVGGQLEDNRLLLARFRAGLAAAAPLLLIVSAFAGYLLSRRALRPVDHLTVALRSISIGNLSRRLPVNPTPDELQRLAETCNRMLSRLEESVIRINRFTADASHELRSPLSLIRGVSEYALRNPQLAPEARESFAEILAESIQAARLLEDMLTLARADAGSADLGFERLDLREVLEEAGENIRPWAEAKQQTVVVQSGAVAVPFNGHRSSLRRLLWTLLDNAVKYTPAQGRIEAALRASATDARITVADTGIGIPETLLPRVFERFFRVDPSRGQVEGAGLGLSIAKWIAEVHQATLLVRSKENQGTEFTVVFPLRQDPEPRPAEEAAHPDR